MSNAKDMGHYEDNVRVNSTPRKIMMVLSTITVEPTVFLTLFTSTMYQLVVQIFYLEKACRVDIGFNSSICDGMVIGNGFGYSESQEAEVQKLVAQMLALRTTIQGLFPPLLLIFIGSWSDRNNRRKPFILLPVIGEILSCSFLVMNAIFFHQLPVIFTAISDSAPLALSGGWPSLFLGVYSYVGTTSSEENRTMRLGIVAVLQMASFIVGNGFGALTFRCLGHTGFFLVCILLLVMALIFGIYLVKEQITCNEPERRKSFFTDFFSLKYFVNTFKACFKSRSDNKTAKVILLMFISTINMGLLIGDINISYMYTKFKFLWTNIEFSMFSTVRLAVGIIGTSFFLIISRKILLIQDTFLGVISMTLSGIGSLIFAFATTGLCYYIGAVGEAFYFNSVIVVRSLMSKLVHTHELAQSNAVLGIIEACAPMVFGPPFTIIYHYSINTFPGAAHVFAALLKLMVIFSFIWVHRLTPRNRKSTEMEIELASSEKI